MTSKRFLARARKKFPDASLSALSYTGYFDCDESFASE